MVYILLKVYLLIQDFTDATCSTFFKKNRENKITPLFMYRKLTCIQVFKKK